MTHRSGEAGGQACPAGSGSASQWRGRFVQKSDILLLDEATAAMDISGKVCVWKSIRTLMAGKTVVYVAHDAQTLQNADWILVLEHGTVTSGGRSPDGFAAKRVLP